MPSAPAPQTALVARLAERLSAAVLETHISWVLLAGELAYKVKKAVRLPFLDYGTIELRRACCEEEVRLNSRLAPSIYLGVTRITGSANEPLLDGPGDVLEYAVRMRRFPAGALFAEQLAAGTLVPAQVDALAALLGDFHERAPAAEADSGFGTPPGRARVALAALQGAAGVGDAAQCGQLRGWLEHEAAALQALWQVRLAAGRVREGHGDLHLDNVVSLDGAVAAFDGIEFDPALRWIDVLDDLAFAMMDFGARGRADLGWRLLNGWLDRTGDHPGLPTLRFSLVYRALVRAQVEHLRGAARAAEARNYLATALGWIGPPAPSLCITHGLPGSGKTFQSQRLLERSGAIRLRSDVERKRLFGLGMLENSRARGIDLYSAAATAKTYAHLFATARMVLLAGFAVVLDAAFLRRDERAAAAALASDLKVPFSILDCQAPPEVLRRRLASRRHDASEADVQVLERLAGSAEPLSDAEQALAIPLPD
jgi:aminoglycoside phosphotransferase family enzyme/predicted kinase